MARKISTEFAETDYISRAMSLIIMAAMLGTPLSLMPNNNTNIHFFVVTSFVCTVAFSILFFIFLPKVFYRPDAESLKNAVRSSIATKNSNLVASSSLESYREDISGDAVLMHPQLHGQLAESNDRLTVEVNDLGVMISDFRDWVQELGAVPDTDIRRRLLKKPEDPTAPSQT